MHSKDGSIIAESSSSSSQLSDEAVEDALVSSSPSESSSSHSLDSDDSDERVEIDSDKWVDRITTDDPEIKNCIDLDDMEELISRKENDGGTAPGLEVVEIKDFIVEDMNKLIDDRSAESQKQNEEEVVDLVDTVIDKSRFEEDLKIRPVDDEEIAERKISKHLLIEVSDNTFVGVELQVIGQVKFYFQIYLNSPENLSLNVGDIDDKKGYFFCAGFNDDNKKEIRLFFLNKDMTKASNILLKNYMKTNKQPIRALKDVSLNYCLYQMMLL